MPNAVMMSKLHQGLDPTRLLQLLAEDEALAGRLVEQLGQPGNLVDVLDSLVGLDADERAYLESIPPVVREAIRGAALQALGDSKSVFVHYSPGYDFEARVMDYGQGVSIHLLGPYPPAPRDEYISADC